MTTLTIDPSREGRAASVACELSARDQRRAMVNDPMGFLLEQARRHGPVVRLALDRESYLVSGTEQVRYILSAEPGRFIKEPVGRRWFASIFGRSLPFLEGSEHAVTRSAMQSMFRPSAQESIPEVVADVVQRDVARWPWDGVMDVAGAVRRMCVSIAGRVVLGIEDEALSSEWFAAVNGVHRYIVAQMPGPVAWPRTVLPWSRALRRHRRAEKRLDELTGEMIRRVSGHGDERPGLLAEIIRKRSTGELVMRDEDVRDHCVNLFVAAVDPIVYGVAWAIYFLADRGDLVSQIAEESDRVIGDGRRVGIEQVRALSHAERAVCEALRMRPTTWLLEREPLEDVELPGGALLSAGSRVMISPYVIHHLEEYFPEPLAFEPGRFDQAERRARSPYAYLPFGAGPRVCIGQHMAMGIGTLMLSLLLARLRFQRDDGGMVKPVTLNGFTIQTPEGKLFMRCAAAGDRPLGSGAGV